MITALVAGFLFLHGFVHLAVWLAPSSEDQPFDPRHSWLSLAPGQQRVRVVGTTAVGLASATAVLYVIAGAAAAVGSPGWATAAFAAACTGLVLKALWFNPWLSLGVLLDAGVLAAVLSSWPSSLY